MARHAAVDLALIFGVAPKPPEPERLSHDAFLEVRAALRAAAFELAPADDAEARLASLRGMYEPFLNSLACYFVMDVPHFLRPRRKRDNWQTTAWQTPPGAEKNPNISSDLCAISSGTP